MALNALGEELKQLGCQVLAVAKMLRETALEYQSKNALTNVAFLLDPDRKLYRQFGLRRSVVKTWKAAMLMTHTHRAVAKLPPALAGKGDDMNVMGGDFILDSSGTLVYSYICKVPRDRPEIADLLEVIKDQSK